MRCHCPRYLQLGTLWTTSTQKYRVYLTKLHHSKLNKKTRLQVHINDIYKDTLNEYNQEIKQARQSFFSKIINENINNSKVLFSTVDRLVNSPSTIPSEMLSSEKCDQFASFFSNKIITIRQNISAIKSTTELAFLSPGTPLVSCLTLTV